MKAWIVEQLKYVPLSLAIAFVCGGAAALATGLAEPLRGAILATLSEALAFGGGLLACWLTGGPGEDS